MEGEETEKRLLTALERTRLGEKLREMRALYEELTAAQDRFCDRFSVHCKAGCGSCCEHFVPDVTEEEAEFLAFGILAQGRAEEATAIFSAWDPQSGTCPLYNSTDPNAHCRFYRYRPMICRLFGASASLDKSGKPEYRRCKWNPEGHSVRSEEFAVSPEDVVVMSDYGEKLEEAASSPETLPISEAILRAIEKVRFMLELEAEEEETRG